MAFDADFCRLHHAGQEHSGIIYCHQRKYQVQDLIGGLALYWDVYNAEELAGRLEYL